MGDFLRFCMLLRVLSMIPIRALDGSTQTERERGARGLPPGGDAQFHRDLESVPGCSDHLSPSSTPLISSLPLSEGTQYSSHPHGGR
ncbi:hypothetical protein VTN02DRAFT_4157 [Thermoascus thermophilus]